jgi:hypothetical protein
VCRVCLLVSICSTGTQVPNVLVKDCYEIVQNVLSLGGIHGTHWLVEIYTDSVAKLGMSLGVRYFVACSFGINIFIDVLSLLWVYGYRVN